MALTLTVRQMLALHRGLNSLDAIKDGKDEFIGFEFSTAVKWRLVCAGVAVEAAKLAFDKMDRVTSAKHGVFEGMEANTVNAAKIAAYTAEMEEVRDTETEVDGLGTFALAELIDRPPSDDKKARKTNPIPVSTLKQLAPILTEK